MSDLTDEQCRDLVPVLLAALHREVTARRSAEGERDAAERAMHALAAKPTAAPIILQHVRQLLCDIEARGDAGRLLPRVHKIRSLMKEGT